MADLGWFIAGPLLLALPLLVWRLSSACRNYLRLPHALAVALALHVIFVLLCMVTPLLLGL